MTDLLELIRQPRSKPRAAALIDSASQPAKTRELRIGLIGFGRVGQAFAARLQQQRDGLRASGLLPRITDILVKDTSKARPAGPVGARLTSDAGTFAAGAFDVLVDAASDADAAWRVAAPALRRGVQLVSCSKALLSRRADDLLALATAGGSAIRFEAAALAGVPCLEALRRRASVRGFQQLAGVFNATSGFVLTQLREPGADLASALALAQAAGLAEPDPSADIDGLDAAHKLRIVLRCLDVGVANVDALEVRGIRDVRGVDLAGARRLGGELKAVAVAERHADGLAAWVGPAFVAKGNPLARVSGLQAALTITQADGESLQFCGPGAGPEVTAATLLDDVVDVARCDPRDEARLARPAIAVSVLPDCATPWILRVSLPRGGASFHQAYDELARSGGRVETFVGAGADGERDALVVRLASSTRDAAERVEQAARQKLNATTLLVRVL